MSRNTMIILGVLAALVLLCVCVGIGVAYYFTRTVTQAVNTDPAKAAEVGKKIADYTLPVGYEQMGFDMFGVSMIMMSTNNQNDPFIMLMQIPESGDRAQFEEQMRQAMSQRMNTRGMNLAIVEEKKATIRGEPVTITVSEGTNDQGTTLRQETAVFRGNNGNALLMVMGNSNAWNQLLVDQFIASIR